MAQQLPKPRVKSGRNLGFQARQHAEASRTKILRMFCQFGASRVPRSVPSLARGRCG